MNPLKHFKHSHLTGQDGFLVKCLFSNAWFPAYAVGVQAACFLYRVISSAKADH